MSKERSQGGSNSKAPEVSSCYVPFQDDITIHIKLVKESASPLFSATVGSIFMEDWTRLCHKILKPSSYPKVQK